MMVERSKLSQIWTIVERFYRTYHLYDLQHENYEQKVAEYVSREGVPRDKIRLGADELTTLLQFKQLERIRDHFLEPLKDACHALFRRDSTTDILDRLVNDIFHEISILKEEHYNVLTYAVNPESRVDREEQKAILDEVHEMFPIKVHRLKHLFDIASARLEKILPKYRDETVLIRSLFRHRNGFVAKAHVDGIVHFYRIMYGPDRAFDGYRAVGDSFYESSFFGEAMEAYAAGEAYLNDIPPAGKRRLDPSWKEARDHFKKRLRSSESQLAAFEAD